MQLKTGELKTLESVIKMLKALTRIKAESGVVTIGGITGTLEKSQITLHKEEKNEKGRLGWVQTVAQHV